MKTCSRCEENKPEDQFGKNSSASDGLNSACKACLNAYQKDRREKMNASKPAEWKKKSADKAAYMRKWHEKNPGYRTRAKQAWLQLHPDRLAVKEKVRYAVRTGKLQKLPCWTCGDEKVEAHHYDYSKPLDVVWLCRKHHVELHKSV